MLANCLPSTGSNTLGLIALAAGLVATGYFLIRSSKSRAAMVALAIAAAGLVTLQTTTKPAEAACGTPTTSIANTLTIQYVGEANSTLVDMPQGNNFTICEHATQNCVLFSADTGNMPIGTTKTLTLGTSPSTLDVTPTQVQCNFQIWSSAPTESTVSAATPLNSATAPTYLVTSSNSLVETAASFSNGTTIYVATMNEC